MVTSPNHNSHDYDRLARLQDKRLGLYTRQTIEEAIEMAQLIGTEQILDVCCGTGDLLQLLALRQHRGAMMGVDFSANMLNVANHHLQTYPNITLKHTDVQSLNLPSDYFHLVFHTNAFHYLDNPKATLGEIRRVLRPHGRLILVDLIANSALTRAWSTIRRLIRPHYTHIYHLEELQNILTQSRFIVVRKKTFRVNLLWSFVLFEVQKPAPAFRALR